MWICYDPDSSHGRPLIFLKVHIPLTKLPVPASSKSMASLSPLQLYLQEIAKYPLLKPEEEFELAAKHFEDGDVHSAHRLITANLRLVVKIANDFRQAQANLLDLIQEGNYGLMQAVKRYNPYKGVKVSSYSAWWIRAYILKYLMDNKSQVKIATTAAQRKLFYNLKRETERLLKEYDHVDSKLIAKTLDVSERDVLEMQKRLGSPDLSLDAPLGEDGTGGTPLDYLQDENRQGIDDLLADEQTKLVFKENLEEFREGLSGRDLDIFVTRVLADDPVTLQEIGDKYKISRERARQIEAKIVDNLREFIRNKGALDISPK
jgi:RNA polymerase sigma-32 factor